MSPSTLPRTHTATQCTAELSKTRGHTGGSTDDGHRDAGTLPRGRARAGPVLPTCPAVVRLLVVVFAAVVRSPFLTAKLLLCFAPPAGGQPRGPDNLGQGISGGLATWLCGVREFGRGTSEWQIWLGCGNRGAGEWERGTRWHVGVPHPPTYSISTPSAPAYSKLYYGINPKRRITQHPTRHLTFLATLR